MLTLPLALLGPLLTTPTLGPGTAPALEQQLPGASLPLVFEENGGRYDADVRFVVRAGLMHALLTDAGPALVLSRADATGLPRAEVALRLDYAGGRAQRSAGLEPKATRIHHFRGADPAQWSPGNRTFGAVRQEGVWPGIDVRFYERDGALEFDFELEPGADPSTIAMNVRGMRAGGRLSVDERGALIVPTAAGALELPAPILHEESAAGPRPVAGSFRVLEDGTTFGFDVGARDASLPLVIDPILSWATMLGSTASDVHSDVAEGPDGKIYVSGFSQSIDLPGTVGAFQEVHDEEGDTWTGYDATVARFSADGSQLEWLTYLGGDTSPYTQGSHDYARSIAIDATGVYIAGDTRSSDFPVTPGAYDTLFHNALHYEGFVTKVALSGDALLWSSYLGENSREKVFSIAVDAAGSAVVGGWTHAATGVFPITAGAAQSGSTGFQTGFVTRFAPDGASLVFSTFLGGNSTDHVYDVEYDSLGRVYAAGVTLSTNFPTPGGFATSHSPGSQLDGFVVRLSGDGSAVEYGTYLGGSAYEDGTNDYGHARLAVGDAGDVWFATFSQSSDYPTTPGVFQEVDPDPCGNCKDLVVTRLDTDATGAASLVWSSYLGAGGSQELDDIGVDAAGNAYVVGYTASTSFPILDAWQPDYGGNNDLVLSVFDPAGGLASSTFFGGSLDEGGKQWPSRLDVRPDGTVFLAASSGSFDIATPGAFQTEPVNQVGVRTALVAKFVPGTPLPAGSALRLPCVGSVLPNAISLQSGEPKIGKTAVAVLDDVSDAGGFTPGETVATWMISLEPMPGYPCGLPVGDLGPGGTLGELLISLTAPNPVYSTPAQVWFGGKLFHELPVPNNPSYLGLQVYTQGVFVGTTSAALTAGLDLTLGV